MRTTVDLPDGLMRRAKATAAMKGRSLKDFFVRAVERELELEQARPEEGKRAQLPLFGAAKGRKRRVTNSEIEEALVDGERLSGRK